MSSPPTGTVTFLFTDIEGSTRLAQQHPRAWANAQSRHHALVREAIESHQGHVFQIVGDAFCVAFHTASDGLAAALTAQRGLHAEPWGETPIRVRMGVHTGEAEFRDNDYRGYLTLVGVQRIMSAAHGGQVLLSHTTATLVRGHLPEGTSLRDLGAQRFKGLLDPEQVLQLVAPDLPADFPPLKTQIVVPNNLPVHVTSFVGRQQELTEAKRLLSFTRLLTLTGPGGTGKTTLALHSAAAVMDDFSDGVYFVNLAPIHDGSLVASTIASTLNVRESGGKPLMECLQDYLREKQLLLLLDNFEQIMDAATLVSELLASAPRVKILVTSREALRLRGEHVFAVPPLALPDTLHLPPLERLSQYAAVALFIQRALAVKPDFTITSENAPAVAEICCRLDGLPLAIELAAARARLLPPQKMLAQLGNRLRFLTSGARDLPERQQSLRDMMDWSYELLTDDEKMLFRQMAVFVGGCTLEAAVAVCNVDGHLDVMNGLQSLMDKSLLKQTEVGGEPRFTLLETIREYALDKLLASGEGAQVRARHLNACVQFAEAVEPNLVGPEQVLWLQRVETDHDNLRAALSSALEQGESAAALRLSGALGQFWFVRGHLSQGRQWLQQASDLSRRAGDMAGMSSDYRGWYANGLEATGKLAWIQGDRAAAQALYEESLALRRELGDKVGIASSLNNLGNVAHNRGDNAAARTLYEESLALSQELGHKQGIAISLNNLGNVALNLGDYATARAFHKESLALCRELDNKQGIAECLAGLAGVAHADGQSRRAAWLLGAVTASLERIGAHLDREDRTEFDRNMAAARAQLDEATFNTAWAEGRALTLEQAIVLALDQEQPWVIIGERHVQ